MVGNPEVKISVGRPRRRWKGDIKMALKVTEWEGVDGIDLAYDRGRLARADSAGYLSTI